MFTTARQHAKRRKTILAGLILGVIGLLSGCSTLDEFAVHSQGGEPRAYTGTGSLVLCDRPLHVVFVHGMGGYSNDDPQPIIDEILRHNPVLRRDVAMRPRMITKNGTDIGRLKWAEYSADCSGINSKRVLRIFVIDWTYSTRPKYVVNRIDQQLKYTDHRLEKHNKIKSWLLNHNLADVILYAGKYRPGILRSVRAAFEAIADDYSASNARNVVVTFSLGSSITFDVLKQMELGDDKNLAAFATDFRTNTTRFFMLGNQILLLRLTNETPRLKGDADQAAPPCADAVESYIKNRSGRVDAFISDEEPWIIAFNDPNDPLSYPIPPDLCPKHPNVFLDIITSVSRKALWVPGVGRLTNPYKAHTGYGRDDQVKKLIVKGYTP